MHDTSCMIHHVRTCSYTFSQAGYSAARLAEYLCFVWGKGSCVTRRQRELVLPLRLRAVGITIPTTIPAVYITIGDLPAQRRKVAVGWLSVTDRDSRAPPLRCTSLTAAFARQTLGADAVQHLSCKITVCHSAHVLQGICWRAPRTSASLT